MVDYKKQGKRNRRKGMLFENLVKKDLESNEWIVSKWANTVDLEKNKLIPAKRKFNPFNKVMSIGTGFPDFIVFKPHHMKPLYVIIGVEVKTNGKLDKIEREKCEWLLKNNIFSQILIAFKNGKEILYWEYGKT